MGFEKRPVVPGCIRKLPTNFSWVDRRFVRERVIERLTRDETLLYFFLAAVADKDGLSFYSDATTAALLKMSADAVAVARRGLVGHDLVAFRRPIYQVLPLADDAPRGGSPASVGDLLRRLGTEGGPR